MSAAPGEEDYVTDVPYARTFIDLLAPPTLRLVAALNGYAAPSGDDFDYCELGSGSGDTAVTLAAANPRARFVGVDFSASQVAFARELARRGAVGNARFVERDFEELAAEDLPSFDFIAAHGVFSWVSPAKRAAVTAFARDKLKPGGLFFVSYNALPGWAAIAPLRRFMLEQTEGARGSTIDRARRGIAIAQRLSDAGGVYFTNHPTARSMLGLMTRAGLPYVAHEYFHQQWEPMYFTDVARAMAAHDLHYVGQVPLYLNFRELTMAPGLAELAAGAKDRVAFEGLKDFAINEFFRSDVYIKGASSPSDAASRRYLDTTPFGTAYTSEPIRRELRLPHASIAFTGPLYDALLFEIAAGASASADLARRPPLAAFGSRQIGDALKTLALGGQVIPMAPRAAPPARDPRRVVHPFNRAVLEEGLSQGRPLVLASPVSRTGVMLSVLDALCVRLWADVPEPEREAWVRDLVARQPLRLVVRDERIDDREHVVRAVLDELGRFSAHGARKLAELGILD